MTLVSLTKNKTRTPDEPEHSQTGPVLLLKPTCSLWIELKDYTYSSFGLSYRKCHVISSHSQLKEKQSHPVTGARNLCLQNTVCVDAQEMMNVKLV